MIKNWLFPLTWLWLLFVFLAATVAIWAHVQLGLNNDNLTLVEQVNKLWQGAVPYIDFIEVTPPLIHLLYLLPLSVTKLTGVPILHTLHGMMLTAIAASLLVSWQLLRHSGASKTNCWLAISAFVLAFLGASFIHQSFAQRDFLMLVLITPWLVLYSPLAQRASIPAPWRMAAAIMGAVGFAIKPYFYVFYLATFIFTWWSGKNLRALLREPEQIIVIGFGAAFLLTVFIFFPAYPRDIIPLGWHTYGAISWPMASKIDIIQQLFGSFGLPALLASVLLWLVAPTMWDRTIFYLLVVLVAAVACYLLNAGWYYTQYPFIAVALVLSVAAGSKLMVWCAQHNHQRQRIARLCLISTAWLAGMFYVYAVPIIQRANMDLYTQETFGHVLEKGVMGKYAYEKMAPHLDSHPRFMFFTTNLWSVTLLEEGSPRKNVGRFDFLWPLPGILQLEKQPEQKSRYEWVFSYVTDNVAEDLVRHAPDMVMNDRSPYQRSLPGSYNALTWLKKNPKFVSAWENYTLVDSIDTCTSQVSSNCAYDVYYRKLPIITGDLYDKR